MQILFNKEGGDFMNRVDGKLEAYKTTIQHNGQTFMFARQVSLSETEVYNDFRSIDGQPCRIYMKDGQVLTDQTKIQKIEEKYQVKRDSMVFTVGKG